MMAISCVLYVCAQYLPASLRLFNVSEALHYLFWFQLGVIVCQFNTTQFLIVSILSALTISIMNPFALLSLAIVLTLYYSFPNKSIHITDVIDQKSFGIYLLHSPLIYITYKFIPNESPEFVLAINFIVFGGFAYVLTSIIKKTKINKVLRI